MRSRISKAFAFVVLPLVAAGCQSPQTRIAGLSVEGRPIEVHSYGHGRDVVLIMATIHGNEAAGTPLVHRLAVELESNPSHLEGRRVVLMPMANPDGFAADTRENANGIDLNRNFPADNFTVTDAHGREPLSEPESRTIKQVLDRERPNRVVSIHQPLACVDWDGPGEGLARAMGEWTDLPVKRLGSRPGSLGSYTGLSHNTPIITLELPREASELDPEALWRQYGNTLLAAIHYPQRLTTTR